MKVGLGLGLQSLVILLPTSAYPAFVRLQSAVEMTSCLQGIDSLW